jgi:purine-binding chemotaxis protein CheW
MTRSSISAPTGNAIELITFSIGDVLYGINISDVVGINKIREVTPVAQAPVYVRGLLNLRGQIVSIIDVGLKLGLPTSSTSPTRKAIIVNYRNELIGLQVDAIHDVVNTTTDQIEKPPANINNIHSGFCQGVIKTQNNIISLLNIDALLLITDKHEA